MADIANTKIYGPGNTVTVLWSNITEADTGLPADIRDIVNPVVQASGDFDASGAVTIEGESVSGNGYGTMRDQLGTALVLTTAVPRVIAEPLPSVRPRATAGTAVVMDVVITGRKF